MKPPRVLFVDRPPLGEPNQADLQKRIMLATVASIKAAGGSMTGDPRPYGNTGIMIGIAIDPAGNRIELIQRP